MNRITPDTLLEFVRLYPRKRPRDWWERWLVAGEAVKWEGASKKKMEAFAWSPIWPLLATGWKDSIPRENEEEELMPPFAYGSGMGWKDANDNEYYQEETNDESQAISSKLKALSFTLFDFNPIELIVKI